MSMIITKQMVLLAIQLAAPSAAAILDLEGATWGPKMVRGIVRAPGVQDTVFAFEGESAKNEEWQESWGDISRFSFVASMKLTVVDREKMNTSALIAVKPWCLREGEFLYAGGAHRNDISAVASGAKGWADEAIGELIISNIIMLARLETDRRIQNKEMQILPADAQK